MSYESLIDYYEKLGILIDCGNPADYRGQEICGIWMIRTDNAGSKFDGCVLYDCKGSSTPRGSIPINFEYVEGLDLTNPNLLTNLEFLGPKSFAPPKDQSSYIFKDLDVSNSLFLMYYFSIGLNSVVAKSCVFEGCEFSSRFIRYSGKFNRQEYSYLNLQESHFYSTSFYDINLSYCDFTGCHFGHLRDLNVENEDYRKKKSDLVRRTFAQDSSSSFRGCEVDNVKFDNSLIESVTLRNTVLQDVSFENSMVEGSTFERCSVLGFVSFANASLKDLVFRDYTSSENPGVLSFENAKLQSVLFQFWSLANTSLKNANLIRCLSSGPYYHGYLQIKKSTDIENTHFKDMALFSEDNELKDCVLENCTYLRTLSEDVAEYTPPVCFENVICIQTVFKCDTKTQILSNAIFKRCVFRDTSLSGDLNDAVFEDVVFESVRFLQADLQGTKFIRCTFEDTHFEHLNLTSTIFKDFKFIGEGKPFTESYYQVEGSILDEATEEFFSQYGASPLSSIEGRGLDLRHLRFYPLAGDVDLSGSDFSKANLEGVDFSQCSLEDVDFTKANLKYADFGDGDNVAGADFRGSNFEFAYGLEERVCESCFKGAAHDESLQLALERPPLWYGSRNQVKEIHICEDCAYTCEVCLDTFPTKSLGMNRDGDTIHSECYGVCEYCRESVPKRELEDYSHLESCEAYDGNED